MVDGGLVGVAGDDDGNAGGFWGEVEVVDGVKHVEEAAAELEDFGGGEEGAGAVGVDVAADGGDGSDLGEGG